MDPEIRTAFWNALADSPYLMVRLDGAGSVGQPMTAMLDKEAHHAIWFFMNRDNALAPGGAARAELSPSLNLTLLFSGFRMPSKARSQSVKGQSSISGSTVSVRSI